MGDQVIRPRYPQPMQPIVVATDGVVRFQANRIIRWLIDTHPVPQILNIIAATDYPVEDREQLLQLIGYSVSGYGDASYVRRSSVSAADQAAENYLRKKRRERRVR